MFTERIDRSHVSYGNQEIFDRDDKEYWEKASIEEKLQTITYLRECFYGKEATTGRLQRLYTLFKQ
jgi:hypothetical protein